MENTPVGELNTDHQDTDIVKQEDSDDSSNGKNSDEENDEASGDNFTKRL